jgi:hypothetical protein
LAFQSGTGGLLLHAASSAATAIGAALLMAA